MANSVTQTLVNLRGTFLGLGLLAGGSTCWAWGHVGHQLLAQEGAQLAGQAQSFWGTNVATMGFLTNVPDQNWKRGASANTEKPTHFFQPDFYVDDPAQFDSLPRAFALFSQNRDEKEVEENGTAPWRAKQFFDLAVEALKKRDFQTAIQMAGVMSHYIGDLSQPLHDTKNYDGADTGDGGIHKFFETDNLEKADRDALTAAVDERAKALLKDAGYAKELQGSVLDILFHEVERAYAHKDELIQADLSQGRTGDGAAALLDLAENRLADGSVTLRAVLTKLWIEGGLSSADGASLRVPVPTWVAPDYGQPQSEASDVSELANFVSQDDCQ